MYSRLCSFTFISCKHGNAVEVHCQLCHQCLLDAQARFSQSNPTVISVECCQGNMFFCSFVRKVDHGMCNVGQLFSVFQCALAVPALTVWTQDRTLWKAKHECVAWKMSLGSVVWWKTTTKNLSDTILKCASEMLSPYVPGHFLKTQRDSL